MMLLLRTSVGRSCCCSSEIPLARIIITHQQRCRQQQLLGRPRYHHLQQHRGRYMNSSSHATTDQQQKKVIDATAQKAAYAFYGKQRGIKKKPKSSWYSRIFGTTTSGTVSSMSLLQSQQQRNMNTAWYSVAIVIGALGASYAAVPLYKVFCQTTGFGGTTQRVLNDSNYNNENDDNNSNNNDDEYNSTMEVYLQRLASSILPAGTAARVHTWTDVDAMERLRSLKPVSNADMITVRFDTTVTDIMPWSFVPVQLDVKVVPGETALSFFRVTNHSKKAITGVATYNVHPPKVGLYFQKIQCFCFEEQRLLPGETVDMPVFFFIDPEIINDPQVSYVRSVTLSYTFFPTDEDDEDIEPVVQKL
jgi:cytochrome c oxidase assembly protein subunit 11